MTTTKNFAVLDKLKNPFSDNFTTGQFCQVDTRYYYVATEVVTGTQSNYVYYSDDKGSSWTKVTPTNYSGSEDCFNVFSNGVYLYAQFRDSLPSSTDVKMVQWNPVASTWIGVKTNPSGSATKIFAVDYYDSVSGTYYAFGAATVNAGGLAILSVHDEIWYTTNPVGTWSSSATLPESMYGAKYIQPKYEPTGISPTGYLVRGITSGTASFQNTNATYTDILPRIYYHDYRNILTWFADPIVSLDEYDGFDWWDMAFDFQEETTKLFIYGGVDKSENDKKDYILYIPVPEDEYMRSDNWIRYYYYREQLPLVPAMLYIDNYLFLHGGIDAKLDVLPNVVEKEYTDFYFLSFKTVTLKITQNIDYQTQLNNRLLSQYIDSTNLKNLLDIYVNNPSNEIEEEIFKLYFQLDIDLESGSQLSQIGNLVGIPRSGWSDYEYKLLIRSKIMRNVCDGTYIDFLRLWKWVTNNPNSYVDEDVLITEVEVISKIGIPSEIQDLFNENIAASLPIGVSYGGLTIE
jgi:hypothetical protein